MWSIQWEPAPLRAATKRVDGPDVPKAKAGTFVRYVSTSGADRRIEISISGERRQAYESYIVPDMEF